MPGGDKTDNNTHMDYIVPKLKPVEKLCIGMMSARGYSYTLWLDGQSVDTVIASYQVQIQLDTCVACMFPPLICLN